MYIKCLLLYSNKLMGELGNYTIDQIAGALALTLGSIGGLCLIMFKSRCERISLCWGAWTCDRKVVDESSEEDKPDDKPEEPIIPPNQDTPPVNP